jgi:selenide,water dikinase
VVGGHSVNDDDIKFGYAVTGLVHPDRIWTNTGARAGDALVFTKRIGTGVISTALKRGVAEAEHVEASIASMLLLNRAAAEALAGLEVHGCTDVTGFGLMGHGRELALGSQVTLEIEAGQVPLLPGALDCARKGAIPGGLKNNSEFAASCVAMAEGIDPALEQLLYDPQTSGGLLVSLPFADARLLAEKFEWAVVIGRVIERQEKPIHVL